MIDGGFTSIFVTAADGARLHVREYGDRRARRLPIVCLPGLTRTGEDFHPLAATLAQAERRVLALDYRGRGRSDYDPDPDRYTIPVELDDLLAVLTARAAAPAVFVGTSRGGLIAMALAVARPKAIAGVVLNDIGPVVEPKGLMRIKTYVGKMPEPKSFDDGAAMIAQLFAPQFTELARADWLAWSRRTWREENGRLVLAYDQNLARVLATIDPAQPVPTLWPQFDALADVPLMVIRGANSDLLSPRTVEEMRARRPDLEFVEVAHQGHAPLLMETDVIARIADFVARCEAARSARI